MNKIKKIGECAYCGKTASITKDHIPPKNIFPEPRASNLITVPCCEPCFRGWSKDDEYFRSVILSSAKVSEEPLSQSVIESLIGSFGRKESQNFANRIINSIKTVEIFTEAGIFLGEETALKIETNRIDRVTQRIIRALFFHEKKYPIPENYKVFGKIQQFGLEPLSEKINDIPFHPLRIIQDGIFCYTFCDTCEDVNSSVWLLLFYKQLSVIGFIKNRSKLD